MSAVTAAAELYPLRHRVLHPELAPDGVGLPGDGRPGARHWKAEHGELGLVGIVSVVPEAVPWLDETAGGWRLRGMATAPEVRGWGIGADLVEAVVRYVRGRDGSVVWCTARTAAVGFYRRQGFATIGPTWEEPVIGTHIHMFRAPGRAGGPGQSRGLLN